MKKNGQQRPQKRQPYMNAEQIAWFTRKLLTLKEETQAHILSSQKALKKRPELNDEADQAQHEEESDIALHLAERETKLLTKIHAALERIRTGEFGYCLETGEPIGIPRLLLRPTAEYCAEVKTKMEVREKHYGKH
jgi:DnaK suppressor protein